ncbi:Holliday junction resolvase MOC1, chloroplastic-like [Aegilops tauschii subsp. strangulata]|nr:Holliday junction resolvase MOC1, chloroplastic-like [Aegilops tauschii subsp. strangulata]
MDWISALRESVSFEGFLSEPVQWYTMAHVTLAPTAIGHGSCSSTGQFVCRLQQDLPPPTAMLRALAVLDQSELYAMIAHGMQHIWDMGWWSTCFLYGLWAAGLVASEFSVVPIVSQKWKAYFGLTESPKVTGTRLVPNP